MSAKQRKDGQWTRDVVTLTVGIALLTASAFTLLKGFKMPESMGIAPQRQVSQQMER